MKQSPEERAAQLTGWASSAYRASLAMGISPARALSEIKYQQAIDARKSTAKR